MTAPDNEVPSTSWAVWAWQAYREGRLVQALATPTPAAMTPEPKDRWGAICRHLTSPEGTAALRCFEQTGSVAPLADHLMALREIGGDA